MTGFDNLSEIVGVELIDTDLYRGRSPSYGWQRVFGGLVVAQSLMAAMHTVEGRQPHSLHAYFLLPGDPASALTYQVERIRDGRSFSTRRCLARQGERTIFSLAASFHSPEPGLEHNLAMPDVPPPEDLDTIQQMSDRLPDEARDALARFFGPDRPFDIKPVDPARYSEIGAVSGRRPPVQAFWMRCRHRLPDDPAIHMALLAYLSDMTLLDAALVTHGKIIFDPGFQVASLDHAVWFHRGFRADSWLLYTQDSPSAAGALALTRGLLFSRDGVLIASVAQEGLIRPIRNMKT